MSSSDPHSKIDFLDSAEPVTTKVHMAACENGDTGGNGLLQITKHILMPLSTLKSDPAFEPRPNPIISPNAPTGFSSQLRCHPLAMHLRSDTILVSRS